jgi:2-dehydro-3-deoxyphosphogluconate aldolase/(4S)-4-hydroxy-2-oxoglutarate aldolase
VEELSVNLFENLIKFNMAVLKPVEMQKYILQEKFIPLYTHIDVEVCKNVMRICYENGIRVFEFTNRNVNSFDGFIQLKQYRDVELPEMKIGIGTIKNATQAKRFIEAGADFLISPVVLEEIQKVCEKEDILWIPGCATPSEVCLAENWGLSLVKIFPAKQLGGPSYIEAIKAVFSEMQFIAKWYNAGVSSVGLGSQLFPKELVKEKAYGKMDTHLSVLVSEFDLLKINVAGE